MANFLNSPELWTARNNGTNPPSYWNGSEYEVVFTTGDSYGLNGSALAEDGVLSGTVTLLAVDPWFPEDATSLVISSGGDVGGGGSLVASFVLSIGVPVEFEVAVTAGNFYNIYFGIQANDNPNLYYGIDAVISPAAEPEPAVILPPYVIRNTWRAYKGATTELTGYVRDELGRCDLTQYEAIAVRISRGQNQLLELAATGDAEGMLTFQVTSQNIEHRLSLLGSFRATIIADDRVIATGLLEVI